MRPSDSYGAGDMPAPKDVPAIVPKRIVHQGSREAQDKLFPIGKVIHVSPAGNDALSDFRLAAVQFGGATLAFAVQDAFVTMQMRFAELAEYVSKLEQNAGTVRSVGMKF